MAQCHIQTGNSTFDTNIRFLTKSERTLYLNYITKQNSTWLMAACSVTALGNSNIIVIESKRCPILKVEGM